MKKLSIIMTSMLMTLGMVGAADASTTWTGFYAGVNAGLAFNNVQLKSQQLGFTSPYDNCNDTAYSSTAFPGIQLGYLYQFPNALVAGIEADVTVNAHQKQTLSCISINNTNVYDRFAFRNQMQTAVKGRMGRAINWHDNVLLPYVTVGTSIANVSLNYRNEGSDYYSRNTTTQGGWLIGAGLEWAFAQHWSLRAEYYYLDYGKAINLNLPSIYGLLDPNGAGRVDLSSNNVAVALNYWV